MIDDPITVVIPRRTLGVVRAAVRTVLKKRARENAKSGFVPEPGHINWSELRVAALTEAEAVMTAALEDDKSGVAPH